MIDLFKPKSLIHMSFYPPLDPVTIKNLMLIQRFMLEDPDYLKNSDYPIEVFSFLKAKREPPKVVEAPKAPEEPVGDLDVMVEIRNTYRELTKFKPDASDTAASMTYYRTRTALLEKLLEQMERGKNQKMISEFYILVLDLLDTVCSPTQRAQFQEKLNEYK